MNFSEKSNFVKVFFGETKKICEMIDLHSIEKIANELVQLRKRNGRLFICGVGGSAGNSSHAVNDFRKLCNIDAYAPTDNISELTARTNDEGWESIFSGWIKVSRANENDSILIFSVGGGNESKKISMNLVNLIKESKKIGMKIFGIVGKNDGYTAKNADVVVIVPQINKERITPHSESFQTIIWHCLVSHPILQVNATKW